MKIFFKRFLHTVVVLIVFVLFAGYMLPKITDDRELVAPASIEMFNPLTGDTEPWVELFGINSKKYSFIHDNIAKIVKKPELLQEKYRDIQPFIERANMLSLSKKHDIPYDIIDSEGEYYENGTDIIHFLNYVKLINILSTSKNNKEYIAALKLSEFYVGHSKSRFDYIIAIRALSLLEEKGYYSKTYIANWRRLLIRAIKSDYYSFSMSVDESPGFWPLFQKKTTKNMNWKYLKIAGQCILSGSFKREKEEMIKIYKSRTKWPLINLMGKTIMFYLIPDYSDYYKESLELEMRYRILIKDEHLK